MIVSRQHLQAALKKERGHRPLTQAAEQRATELEMWDQIRRIEEKLMGRGTMGHALLQGDSVGVH